MTIYEQLQQAAETCRKNALDALITQVLVPTKPIVIDDDERDAWHRHGKTCGDESCPCHQGRVYSDSIGPLDAIF